MTCYFLVGVAGFEPQLAPTDMLDGSVLVIDKHEEVSIPIPAAPTPHSPTVTATPDRAHPRRRDER
jgi:hypothetical protein